MCDIPISDVHFLRNVAPLLFLHGRWRLWSICHINKHVFSIILLTFLQILHSKIPSPGKLVKRRHIWRHDLQTESTGSRRSELIGNNCSRCERVDNSTSSWVELCRYKRPFRRIIKRHTFTVITMVITVFNHRANAFEMIVGRGCHCRHTLFLQVAAC